MTFVSTRLFRLCMEPRAAREAWEAVSRRCTCTTISDEVMKVVTLEVIMHGVQCSQGSLGDGVKKVHLHQKVHQSSFVQE